MGNESDGAAIDPASLLALAQDDLACYALANFPAFDLPPFLDLVVRKLEAVERGELKRLVLSLPPRHSKSLTASVFFPAWYLGRNPSRYVISTSYGDELSSDFGRKVRNTMRDPLHRSVFPASKIADDSSAAHRFDLTAGGAYYAVGRGAAITGRGAHLLLCDDMLKDFEEANSPTIRRALRDWFQTVAFTRLMPDASVIVTATRWHQDDLSGWLLDEFASEGWEALTLPAIAEENDPAGREVGAALWPERYPLETLLSIKRQIGSAQFASLYQQRPAPAEGHIFKSAWFREYAAPPAESEIVRVIIAIDTAFKTGSENDYSAAFVIAETATDYYILHAWRDRVEFPDLVRKIIELSDTWGGAYGPYAIVIEDRASGQSLIQELDRETNLPVIGISSNADKVARAVGVTGIIEAGKVWLPIGAPWRDDFVEELTNFPASKHDDWTDAMVHGLTYALVHGMPGVY